MIHVIIQLEKLINYGEKAVNLANPPALERLLRNLRST